MDKIDQLAKILWDYNVLDQPVQPADVIIALGNSDVRTAQKAAELFNQNMGQWLVTTGGYGRLTKDEFQKPEAQIFAQEAVRLGVPEDKIIIEDQSTNTFDNLRLTRQHLDERGIAVKKVIVVTKPYMERRALATVKKRWPDIEVTVASPALTYETYPNEKISNELLINMLVGDTQRILPYGKIGYLEIQDVPEQVENAMEELIKLGYDQQLTTTYKLPK
jgi:uncharacterized SAM-binding protein YcdF (DUF218 family)